VVIVSESVSRAFLRKLYGAGEFMGVESIEELGEVIHWVVEAPDEVYADLLSAKYFLNWRTLRERGGSRR